MTKIIYLDSAENRVDVSFQSAGKPDDSAFYDYYVYAGERVILKFESTLAEMQTILINGTKYLTDDSGVLYYDATDEVRASMGGSFSFVNADNEIRLVLHPLNGVNPESLLLPPTVLKNAAGEVQITPPSVIYNSDFLSDYEIRLELRGESAKYNYAGFKSVGVPMQKYNYAGGRTELVIKNSKNVQLVAVKYSYTAIYPNQFDLYDYGTYFKFMGLVTGAWIRLVFDEDMTGREDDVLNMYIENAYRNMKGTLQEIFGDGNFQINGNEAYVVRRTLGTGAFLFFKDTNILSRQSFQIIQAVEQLKITDVVVNTDFPARIENGNWYIDGLINGDIVELTFNMDMEFLLDYIYYYTYIYRTSSNNPLGSLLGLLKVPYNSNILSDKNKIKLNVTNLNPIEGFYFPAAINYYKPIPNSCPYNFIQLADCENACVLKWISQTGVWRQMVWRVKNIKTTATTERLQTIGDGYIARKGREVSFTAFIEGLNSYDYWYYADIIASPKVYCAIRNREDLQDGNAQVEITTDSYTLLDGNSGELRTLEVEIKYRHYDTL